MLQIKSKERSYGINFPTTRKEITKDVITKLLENVNLPRHYAVVALCSKMKLFDYVSSIGSKKDYNVGIDVCLGKINPEDNEHLKADVNEFIVVDRSALERGNHLTVNTMITYNNAARYIKSDDALCKSIFGGEYNEHGVSPTIYLLEFKIIPVVDIKAVIKESDKIVDPFMATIDIN